MTYGSGGKNFNVGLQSKELLPAKKEQIALLRRLDRREPPKGLNRAQIEKLIEEAEDRKEQAQRGLTQMEGGMIAAIWQIAIKAANKAGDAWVEAHQTPLFAYYDKDDDATIPVYGAIGQAWLTWPQRGTPLYKWLRENNVSISKGRLEVPHKYQRIGRVEGELQFVCYKAALNILTNASFATGLALMMCSDTIDPRKAA
jgi:hypothetical protein